VSAVLGNKILDSARRSILNGVEAWPPPIASENVPKSPEELGRIPKKLGVSLGFEAIFAWCLLVRICLAALRAGGRRRRRWAQRCCARPSSGIFDVLADRADSKGGAHSFDSPFIRACWVEQNSTLAQRGRTRRKFVGRTGTRIIPQKLKRENAHRPV